jgi:hypothetical protein
MKYLFTIERDDYKCHFYYENGIYYRIVTGNTYNNIFDVMKYIDSRWNNIYTDIDSDILPKELHIFDDTLHDMSNIIDVCNSRLEKLIFDKL